MASVPYDPSITLEDLERLESPVITAAQAAPFLRTDPNLIRWQAHHEPEKLGFPVSVAKSRVKIPRLPFLEFIRGKKASA